MYVDTYFGLNISSALHKRLDLDVEVQRQVGERLRHVLRHAHAHDAQLEVVGPEN